MSLIHQLEVPFVVPEGFLSSLGSRIGAGGFGEVMYRTISDDDSREHELAVGVKNLLRSGTNFDDSGQSDGISPETISQAFVEICVMKHPRLAKHENIVNLLGITVSEFVPAFCLVTEFADLGSLGAYLSSHPGQLHWNIKTKLLRDIATGLCALHGCDIVHNDVKCANVLLFTKPAQDGGMIAKIADFGCSVPLAVTENIHRHAPTDIYAAPEAYTRSCPVLPSRDVYSLGFVVLHLATEEPPLRNVDNWVELKNDDAAMQKYARHHLELAGAPVNIVDNSLMALRKNPEERRDINKFLNGG